MIPGIQNIQPSNDPDSGRNIINTNFLLVENAIAAIEIESATGSTIVSAGTNISTTLSISGTNIPVYTVSDVSWAPGTGLNSVVTYNGNTGNAAGGFYSVITGFQNSGSSEYSFIGGGITNQVINNGGAFSTSSGIIGGGLNVISGASLSFIGGGSGNIILNSSTNVFDAIIGGFSNQIILSKRSVIAGGTSNVVSGGSGSSFIGAAQNSFLLATTNSAIIATNGITGASNNTLYTDNLNAGSGPDGGGISTPFISASTLGTLIDLSQEGVFFASTDNGFGATGNLYLDSSDADLSIGGIGLALTPETYSLGFFTNSTSASTLSYTQATIGIGAKPAITQLFVDGGALSIIIGGGSIPIYTNDVIYIINQESDIIINAADTVGISSTNGTNVVGGLSADTFQVGSYTPTGSFDSTGENGSITFDNNYIYWKVGSIWYRAAGSEWNICLAKGTKILLSNNTYKNIEDITYEDSIKTWNFDEGVESNAYPLWIKIPEFTDRYNLLIFSDGSNLKTISQHRIFNIEKGMFTYPMTDDTPIGTTTFNSRGEKVTLVSKDVVFEYVEYYNVITDKDLNLFGNDILTSCRYNNIYPIVDMKFIKDNRNLRTKEEFKDIPDKYYYGLRLEEQTFNIDQVKWYVDRLISKEVQLELA